MALKPTDNESFYREVDEQLRREQLQTTWQRYGIWIIAGVILLLAALAGFIYWQNQQQKKAEQQAEQVSALFEDLQAGKTKGAEAKLDAIAKEGSPG